MYGTKGCYTHVRFSMLTFNLLFTILSVTLIAIGASLFDVSNSFDSFLHELRKYAYFLIIFGCVLLLVSCFGCYCTFTRNRHILVIFTVLMILLILFEMGLILYLKMKYVEVKMNVAARLKTSFSINHLTSDSFWDTLQTNFICCGNDSIENWMFLHNSDHLPASCCAELNQTGLCTEKYAKKITCQEALNEYFRKLNAVCTVVGMIFIAFQVVVVTLTVVLYHEITRLEEIEIHKIRSSVIEPVSSPHYILFGLDI